MGLERPLKSFGGSADACLWSRAHQSVRSAISACVSVWSWLPLSSASSGRFHVFLLLVVCRHQCIQASGCCLIDCADLVSPPSSPFDGGQGVRACVCRCQGMVSGCQGSVCASCSYQLHLAPRLFTQVVHHSGKYFRVVTASLAMRGNALGKQAC